MSNGDWNDISSAPKTSERFQAWESLPEWPSPHGRVIRAWWQPFGDEIGWHDDLTRKPIIGQLTHWMPLPPPPTVTAAPTLGDRFDQQEKFAASQMKQTAASLETATREQASEATVRDVGSEATSKKSTEHIESAAKYVGGLDGPYKLIAESVIAGPTIIGGAVLGSAEGIKNELNNAYAAGQATPNPRSQRIEEAAKAQRKLDELATLAQTAWPSETGVSQAERDRARSTIETLVKHLPVPDNAALEQENPE